MREAFTKQLKDDGKLEVQTYGEYRGVKIGTPAFTTHLLHNHKQSVTEVWFVDMTNKKVTTVPKRIQDAQLLTRINGQFDLYKHDAKQDVMFTAPSGQYLVYVGRGSDAFVGFVKMA